MDDRDNNFTTLDRIVWVGVAILITGSVVAIGLALSYFLST